MIIWLKFASPKLNVNSACTDDFLVTWGEPHMMPAGKGLYRNWGGFFDFGDVIEIPGGVQIKGTLMKQWSISFWTILPMKLFETHKKHTLVQSIHGEGAFVRIDETQRYLECVCESTGKVIGAGIDILKQPAGWHNI